MRVPFLVRVTILLLVSLSIASPLVAQSSSRGRSRGTPNHTVRVQSNVPGAIVSIDSQGTQGAAPQELLLQPGTYTFRVSAPGYREWSLTAPIDRDQNLVANLEPITHTLTVTANVPAQVVLNGTSAGSTRLQRSLQPGRYDVTVQADGYIEFTTTVDLNDDRTVSAQLKPATAQVGVRIPQELQVPGDSDGLIVLVDGQPVAGASFTVRAGRHTVTVRAGGLEAIVTHDFAAGQSYTLVPNFGVQVQ